MKSEKPAETLVETYGDIGKTGSLPAKADTLFQKLPVCIRQPVRNHGEVREVGEITVCLSSLMLLDRLNTLAAEYSVSVELLVNLAVKRLVDDIDFLRELRTGKIEAE